MRPSVTRAVVVPQGPVAAPSSSVADPQLALTCRVARFSSISTASLSYGGPPAEGASLAGAAPGAGWSVSALGAFGGGASPPVGSGPADAGTQSDPLSTVPSGQVPGESAPFAPPPQAAAATQSATATRDAPIPSPFMGRIIAPIQRSVILYALMLYSMARLLISRRSAARVVLA